MVDINEVLACKIDKKCIIARITFALKNIPEADTFTLNKLIELLNTTGTFGSITALQLLSEMHMMKRYIPQTCPKTLWMLLDLLKSCVPKTVEEHQSFIRLLNEAPKFSSLELSDPK